MTTGSVFSIFLTNDDRRALEALARQEDRERGPYLRSLLRREARKAGLLPAGDMKRRAPAEG